MSEEEKIPDTYADALAALDEVERWIEEHCPQVARGGLATVRRVLRRNRLLASQVIGMLLAQREQGIISPTGRDILPEFVVLAGMAHLGIAPAVVPDNPVPGPTPATPVPDDLAETVRKVNEGEG